METQITQKKQARRGRGDKDTETTESAARMVYWNLSFDFAQDGEPFDSEPQDELLVEPFGTWNLGFGT